jgi:tyrosinase
MKCKSSIYFFSIFVILMQSCAVVPTCPNSSMPTIEIQVNNTESNHDDYISTSGFIPCRARIVNIRGGINNRPIFPTGVEVEIRNKRLSSDLIISAASSGSSTSFFTTLPGDGSWLNFFIRGNAISSQDKSSIIEIATAGVTCNEVVAARKGLMVSGAPSPIPNTLPQVAIEVGSIATIDDYISWSPVYSRIKWLNPPSATSTINVTIRNMEGLNRLRFASGSLSSGTTATNATITLTLNGDGAWVPFYVAGNNGNASIEDKDAIFEVMESTNLLAREAVMVRIRKNANTLTVTEREKYLEAVREVHQTYDFYMLFRNSHSQDLVAHRQAHSGSAFLPWHRAFMLHFERLLQASDPSVALPYWHFDQSSPNIFSTNFMGSNPTAPATQAILNATNPISTWQIPSVAVGIRRRTPYGDNGIPNSVTGTGTSVNSETATLSLGSNYANFTIEVSTHNGAHNNSGNAVSWLAGSPANAPQDPLFYLLHSNVDRLWGKWQWVNNRFDPMQVATYNLQGGHSNNPSVPPQLANGVNRTFGQYAEDTMWPWDNITGTSQGTANTLIRPAVAPLTPFPIVIGGFWPMSKPTVKSTIDFRLLNISYDDFYPY